MGMKTNSSNEGKTFNWVRQAGGLMSWGEEPEEPKRLCRQLCGAESQEGGYQECANLEHRAKKRTVVGVVGDEGCLSA